MKRRDGDTVPDGHGPGKVQAGLEFFLPQARECLGLSEVGRGEEGACPRGFRGITVLQTPSF